MKIKGPDGKVYEVGKPLGGTDMFKIHECILPDKRVGFLKITTAYILDVLRTEATETEIEYAKSNPGKGLNYRFYFPELIENFICAEQENRRIIIVCMSEVSNKLGDLVPLGNLISKANERVDPRSSAWILSKLLKLLTFVHNMCISVGEAISRSNILIHRENHYVSIFDWSNAFYNMGGVEPEACSDDLSRIAEQVIVALGGDPETGKLLEDDQLADGQYEDFLKKLLFNEVSSAKEAHEEFNVLKRELWPRGKHPFTTHKITN